MLPTIVVDHTLRHPHLEADVLASLLKKNSSWICAQEIEAQDFSNKDYQLIFESIQAQGSLPINVTVLQETFAFSPLSDIIRRLVTSSAG